MSSSKKIMFSPETCYVSGFYLKLHMKILNEIVIPSEITIPKMDFQDVCIFPNEIIILDSPAMSPENSSKLKNLVKLVVERS